MTEKEKYQQRAAFIKLGFTEEEIAHVMKADEQIDKGEKLFEQTAEQKAASKKARQAQGDKTQYKPRIREKTVNQDKINIMKAFADALPQAENLEFTNVEREMVFTLNGVKYKVTLACPRT